MYTWLSESSEVALGNSQTSGNSFWISPQLHRSTGQFLTFVLSVKGQILLLVESIGEFYLGYRNLLVHVWSFCRINLTPAESLRHGDTVKHQRNSIQLDYRRSYCFEACIHLFSITKVLFKHHWHFYLSMTSEMKRLADQSVSFFRPNNSFSINIF